jgi:hypothetical protein
MQSKFAAQEDDHSREVGFERDIEEFADNTSSEDNREERELCCSKNGTVEGDKEERSGEYIGEESETNFELQEGCASNSNDFSLTESVESKT